MAGRRRRLTAEEEALLSAGGKLGWRGTVPSAIFHAIRLLEVGAKVWETERDPEKILEAVFMGPAAVAQASTRYYGWKGAARGTLTVIRPWLFKRPGRPREPWEASLAEYDALRKAGKSADASAHEVAKRCDPKDVGHDPRIWIRNLQDRRRRARKRSAAK